MVQVNLNNRLCSVLHAVCLVRVATLCVMLSLVLCCPARALGYTKWLSIQELLVFFPSLDYIILTEHQLSAEFRQDEIIKSGWDFHAVSGTVTTLPQRGYRGQRYRGGLALLTRNSMRFFITIHSLSWVVNTIFLSFFLGFRFRIRDSQMEGGKDLARSLGESYYQKNEGPFGGKKRADIEKQLYSERSELWVHRDSWLRAQMFAFLEPNTNAQRISLLSHL